MSGDGMSAFVTALTGTNGISIDNMWAQLTDAAPLIITAVFIAFGVYEVRKVIKGLGKGKIRA